MNLGRRAELLVHDGRPLPPESGRSNRQRRRNDHQGREGMLDLERLLLTSFRSSTAQGATCTCTEPLLTSAPIDVRNAVSVGKTCANVSTSWPRSPERESARMRTAVVQRIRHCGSRVDCPAVPT